MPYVQLSVQIAWGLVEVKLQGGSPRPPYIGQRMRSVPRLLVGCD
jgi:hypothetical protein